MSQAKKPEWSNDLQKPDDLDKEVKTLTPDEVRLNDLAKDMKDVKPEKYNIKSKNAKAMRVVHDSNGEKVAILPGETKAGVMLYPHIAEYLGKGDLEITASTA
jgi:outer membrane murein-binding lipoprotein Lpp